MIGSILQYILYALVWVMVLAAVSGLFLVWQARRGAEVSLDAPVATLALLAGTAPYVGLFGTVWHIIQALTGMGAGQLSVAEISAPIGEALYATLWGLGCAIPALVAHRVILMLAPEDAA